MRHGVFYQQMWFAVFISPGWAVGCGARGEFADEVRGGFRDSENLLGNF